MPGKADPARGGRSSTLGDLQARAGDTEEVDCQRAEAHLRLLAEEELRRPAWPRRIRWAAELLIAIGALDDEVADRIVADFDLALLARQAFPTPAGRAARLQRGSAGVRFWPAVPVTSLPPRGRPGAGPGGPAGAGDPLARRARRRGVPAVVRADRPGHQLSLYVRPTRQVVDPVGSEAGILEQFTATDDRGPATR